MRRFGGLAIATAIVSALASTSFAGGPLATRVVDRTFVCKIAEARGGYPDPVARERVLQIGMRPETDNAFGSAYVTDIHAKDFVLWMQSRQQTGTQGPGGIAVNRKRCSWIRDVRIPLSASGLQGPSRFADKPFDCQVSRRLLVRVRAEMERPVSWRVLGDAFRVGAAVSEVRLAIRTQASRRPIAFGAMNRSGETTLYASPSRCKESF
jgi:hypothetical protein